MLIVSTTADLARATLLPLDANASALIVQRCDQLGGDLEDGARFYVVEPADHLCEIEATLGYPIEADGEPLFEWALDHHGVFELTFIMSDDGPAEVLLVPLADGIDQALLNVCQRHAVAASVTGVAAEGGHPNAR